MFVKCCSWSSFWTSLYVCLEHNSRILHCSYFHLVQARKEPEGSHPAPLMSEHPAHSSSPAADLALFQRRVFCVLLAPANVPTYVG